MIQFINQISIISFSKKIHSIKWTNRSRFFPPLESTPFIRYHCRTRTDIVLIYWQQSSSITNFYKANKFFFCFTTIYYEHPLFWNTNTTRAILLGCGYIFLIFIIFFIFIVVSIVFSFLMYCNRIAKVISNTFAQAFSSWSVHPKNSHFSTLC